MKARFFCSLVAIAAVLASNSALSDAFVRSAVGANAGAVKPVVNAFRTDIGGSLVSGPQGSFEGIRREINWDGVSDTLSAPANFPADFFNTSSTRGVVLSTPGTGFQLSADVGNAAGAPISFGNLNAAYSSAFTPFSGQRMLTALESNTMDVDFFVAGSTNPATVRGFGAVFTDVDTNGTTAIEYFDENNQSLGRFLVPAAPAATSVSFLGVTFTTELVSRVRITSGNNVLGAAINDDPPVSDLVVVDDFIYSEPVARAAATTIGVVSPNGGEVFLAGSTVNVTWSPGDASKFVAIELSRAGSAFETVLAGTPDDGSQSITISGPASSDARIRVRSTTNDLTSDVSNAPFTIIEPSGDLGVTLEGVKIASKNGRTTLTGTARVSNAGPATNGGFTLFVFGSPKKSLGAGATLLTTQAGSTVAVGSSVPLKFKATLPAGSKSIVVHAVVAAKGSVTDQNGNNDTVSQATKLLVK